jgi:dihydroorotase
MLLIKNATIFKDTKELKTDILIEDGKISKIEETIDLKGVKTLDISGKYLLAGIVDLNVRIKDNALNLSHLNRLKNKAKKSGVTTFALMPDFSPNIASETFSELLKTKLDEMKLDIILSVKAIKNENNKELNDIAIMIENGAKIIQARSHIDGNLLRRVLQYSLMKDVPFFCFCDNPDLNDNGVMHEGRVSAKLGLAGVSKISEISEVARVSSMCEYYGSKTLFQSLSTSRSLEIVESIKKEGKPAYSEVSISHLILNDKMCNDFNTLAKLHPPLRDEDERLKLIDALKSGKVDTITSLHSAKSYNSKDVAFNDASYGVDSLEHFLSLCYTYLVKKEIISFEKLSSLISATPAKILGFDDLGKIEEGFIANLVVFDPNISKTIDDKASLFNKFKISGEVVETISRGNIL